MSRTEELLEALAQALEARERVETLKRRYAKMDAASVGEPPLEAAMAPVMEFYVKKLDVVRAQLTACGVTV